MSKMKARAFTRIEGIILGLGLMVLAMAVVPRFSEAKDDSRLSRLVSELQLIRNQIQLYRIQHAGRCPEADRFVEQLTQSSKPDGRYAAPDTPGYPLGPYLQEVPENPFTRTRDVTQEESGPQRAWYYNPLTGEFRSNDGIYNYL